MIVAVILKGSPAGLDIPQITCIKNPSIYTDGGLKRRNDGIWKTFNSAVSGIRSIRG
jgi:hypothetical protein